MPQPAFATPLRSAQHQGGTPIADAVLVAQARLGDPGAFEVLVRRHVARAMMLVQSIVPEPADADDVCQEALVRCWDRLHQCRDGDAFVGWMMTIMRMAAYDFHRRARRRPTESLESADGVTMPGPPPEPSAALRRALATLSPVQREVLLLADLDDLPHREIAARLGLSEFMSRRHLSDARRRMRAALANAKEALDGTP